MGRGRESDREWVGTPLDVDDARGHGIQKIEVEFDEGKEVLTPRLNKRLGSCDLYEAGHYINSLFGHVDKGRDG